MPFVQAKCTNCGGVLAVDDSKDAAICPFCNTPYIVEKAINNYSITNNISIGYGAVVNIIGSESNDFEIVAGKLIKYKGALRDVVIPDTVTIIGEMAFNDLEGIRKVTIPKSVTSIEDSAFQNCKNLKRVNMPKSVTSIGSFDACAFEHCSSLKTAGPIGSGCDYEFGWTKSIPPFAFAGCIGLESITLPDSITSIGPGAFSRCLSLKNITIPQNVTSIGARAFESCRLLTSISIPESVTRIGVSVFEDCSNLIVTVCGSDVRITPSTFLGCKKVIKAYKKPGFFHR